MFLKHLVKRIGYGIRVRQLEGNYFAPAALPFTVVGDYDSRHYKVEYDDGRTGVIYKDVGFGKIHFGIFREVFVDGLACSKGTRMVCNQFVEGSIPSRSTFKDKQCLRSISKTSLSTSSPQSSCGSLSGFLSWCRQLFG